MLEARAHNQVKQLLEGASYSWPHHLTLSRLVARTLRRRDTAFIQLEIGSQDFWWIGLLTPLCFESTGVVLVQQSEELAVVDDAVVILVRQLHQLVLVAVGAGARAVLARRHGCSGRYRRGARRLVRAWCDV